MLGLRDKSIIKSCMVLKWSCLFQTSNRPTSFLLLLRGELCWDPLHELAQELHLICPGGQSDYHENYMDMSSYIPLTRLPQTAFTCHVDLLMGARLGLALALLAALANLGLLAGVPWPVPWWCQVLEVFHVHFWDVVKGFL